jgi:hypothetical protein
MRTRTLYSWETRRYSVTVTSDTDPTGDTIEYGIVDSTTGGDPASWTAGTWTTSFVDGNTVSYSPTYGTTESTPSPDVVLVEGTTYRVFARTRNATDAPGDLVAVLKVA